MDGHPWIAYHPIHHHMSFDRLLTTLSKFLHLGQILYFSLPGRITFNLEVKDQARDTCQSWRSWSAQYEEAHCSCSWCQQTWIQKEQFLPRYHTCLISLFSQILAYWVMVERILLSWRHLRTDKISLEWLIRFGTGHSRWLDCSFLLEYLLDQWCLRYHQPVRDLS